MSQSRKKNIVKNNFKVNFAIEIISRLNSGILTIFEVNVENLNLKSSDCRASKFISNDTKFDSIS